MYVSSRNTDCLRAQYNDAFDDWALQVSRLHAMIKSSPGGAALHDAAQLAAAAEVVYRESRDKLTDELIVGSSTRSSCDENRRFC